MRVTLVIVLSLLFSSFARSARAASEFQCGPGGSPNKATSKCNCPAGKVEATRDDVSRCIDAKPIAPPKVDLPPVPPKVEACPAGLSLVAGRCVAPASADCPVGKVRIGTECVACPAGSHFESGQCTSDAKPAKAPTYPERYCLISPTDGSSVGCYADAKGCATAEADFAAKLVKPPTCSLREEVACFTQGDGSESCQLTLDACREQMLSAGKTFKIKRACAIQNRAVGVPKVVPEWTIPNERHCVVDETGKAAGECFLFRGKCEASAKQVQIYSPKHTLSCRLSDPVYCMETGDSEICQPTMEGCAQRQWNTQIYSPNTKIVAGCGAQSSGGAKTRGPIEWLPPAGRVCGFYKEKAIACYMFRAGCEPLLASGSDWSCRDVTPVSCFQRGNGDLACQTTLEKCRSDELGALKVFAADAQNRPVTGCVTERVGVKHPSVPLDERPAERWCTMTNGKIYGCHDYRTECEDALPSGWTCQEFRRLFCFTAESGNDTCEATLDACHENEIAYGGKGRKTGCFERGVGVTPNPVPPWEPPPGRYCKKRRHVSAYSTGTWDYDCDHISAAACIKVVQEESKSLKPAEGWQAGCEFRPIVACLKYSSLVNQTSCHVDLESCEKKVGFWRDSMHYPIVQGCALQGTGGPSMPIEVPGVPSPPAESESAARGDAIRMGPRAGGGCACEFVDRSSRWRLELLACSIGLALALLRRRGRQSARRQSLTPTAR